MARGPADDGGAAHLSNEVGDRDGGSSQEGRGLPTLPAWGSQQRLPCLGGDGQGEVCVMGGESCWTRPLAGQLILHLFSPDQPVSSNIIIN